MGWINNKIRIENLEKNGGSGGSSSGSGVTYEQCTESTIFSNCKIGSDFKASTAPETMSPSFNLSMKITDGTSHLAVLAVNGYSTSITDSDGAYFSAASGEENSIFCGFTDAIKTWLANSGYPIFVGTCTLSLSDGSTVVLPPASVVSAYGVTFNYTNSGTSAVNIQYIKIDGMLYGWAK